MAMFFQTLLLKIKDFFIRLGKGIVNFFKNLPANLKNFFIKLGKGIRDWFQKYIRMFREGDIGVKLSYVFMGSGAFVHKQYVKGAAYLGIELLFIFYMIFNGAGAIRGFFTLGTDFPYNITYLDQSSSLANQTQSVAGDNSMLSLLFGVSDNRYSRFYRRLLYEYKERLHHLRRFGSRQARSYLPRRP